jgi:hypothetical protein
MLFDGTVLAFSAFVTAGIKRQIARMIGEFLREVGVLVVVFGPLEALVTYGTLPPWEIVAIVVLAGPSLVLGMYLGVER